MESWRWIGVAAVAITAGSLPSVAPDARGQDDVSGSGPLACGTLQFTARDLGPDPFVIAAGQAAGLISTPVFSPCGGPLVATFTGELYSPDSATVAVSMQASCLALEAPGPRAPGACTPGTGVSLQPLDFILVIPGDGRPQDTRSVSAGALLPPGQFRLEVSVLVLTGTVHLNKAFLSASTGGQFPASSRRLSSGTLDNP